MTATKIPLQEYADKIIAGPFAQQLKTIHDALGVHGWDVVEFGDGYTPSCCGTPVDVQSFLGYAYHAECSICGNFSHDMTGPRFGNGHVNLIDTDKVDCTTENTWIAGTRSKGTP